jgi:phosphotransferase system  glucose/maltose/N-acetylglucosamine-specific IIC component
VLDPVPEHPNLPRRGPLALMFGAIAIAGILGGLIGYGIMHATCDDSTTNAQRLLEQVPGFHAQTTSCDWQLFGAAIIGTVVAAIGAAVIAVLLMRAQSEWKVHRPG